MRDRFQFINWFPEWRGFYFARWHKGKSDIVFIYDWFLGFAFWEIRKWHKLKPSRDDLSKLDIYAWVFNGGILYEPELE